MGFTHDTHMSQFIPVNQISKSAGTWTESIASNVHKSVRTAADAAFSLFIPIPISSNGSGLKGARLKSIDVFYTIGTAACDDFATVELEKIVLPAATGSAPTGAAVSTTVDTGHDTAAERLAVASHKMTVTLDAPAWVDDDDAYVLQLVVDAAATTVFTLWGARANYDFRV